MKARQHVLNTDIKWQLTVTQATDSDTNMILNMDTNNMILNMETWHIKINVNIFHPVIQTQEKRPFLHIYILDVHIWPTLFWSKERTHGVYSPQWVIRDVKLYLVSVTVLVRGTIFSVTSALSVQGRGSQSRVTSSLLQAYFYWQWNQQVLIGLKVSEFARICFCHVSEVRFSIAALQLLRWFWTHAEFWVTIGLTELGNQHGAYLLWQFLPDQFLNEQEACLCARYDLSVTAASPLRVQARCCVPGTLGCWTHTAGSLAWRGWSHFLMERLTMTPFQSSCKMTLFNSVPHRYDALLTPLQQFNIYGTDLNCQFTVCSGIIFCSPEVQ